MLNEFREFAVKGNVVDMAVGIIIGGAFGTIVSSLVNDILMPPIGLILGGIDFSNVMLVLKGEGPFPNVEAAADAGAVTMNVGLFINAIISLLIVAWSLFLVVTVINRRKREEAEPTEEAPAEPPRQEVLLEEIRDLMKKQAAS